MILFKKWRLWALLTILLTPPAFAQNAAPDQPVEDDVLAAGIEVLNVASAGFLGDD